MSIDPSWKGLYKASGLSLFVGAVILVIFVISVFVMQIPIPLDPQAVLDNPVPTVTLFILAVIGELLLMPAVLGLYFSLKDVNKTHMLIATALWLVAVIMFLVSRGLIISLLPISESYAAAPSETLKAAYFASAELALELENTYATMALILLNVATVIIGWVMLKGVFGKRIGYVVIVAGIVTLFTPFAVMIEIPLVISLIGLVLTGVWQLYIGVKLYQLG